jgi:AraC family transcriptional regulator
LLTASSKSIATIAMETGFSSHAHLTDSFKTKLGVTPRQIREAGRPATRTMVIAVESF